MGVHGGEQCCEDCQGSERVSVVCEVSCLEPLKAGG